MKLTIERLFSILATIIVGVAMFKTGYAQRESEYRKQSSESERVDNQKYPSLIASFEVPTFSSVSDAQRYNNRFASDTSGLAEVVHLKYKDTIVCVPFDSIKEVCFTLYDLTER